MLDRAFLEVILLHTQTLVVGLIVVISFYLNYHKRTPLAFAALAIIAIGNSIAIHLSDKDVTFLVVVLTMITTSLILAYVVINYNMIHLEKTYYETSYKKVIDESPYPICLTNEDGVINYHNKVFSDCIRDNVSDKLKNLIYKVQVDNWQRLSEDSSNQNITIFKIENGVSTPIKSLKVKSIKLEKDEKTFNNLHYVLYFEE